MNNIVSQKKALAFAAALLLVCVGSSCTSLASAPGRTPAVQTIQVTRLVTREVTQEVTRVVEVPVTVTPAEISQEPPAPSQSPTSTEAATAPALPVVSILSYVDCMDGPASIYLYQTNLPASAEMEVAGRSLDGTWLLVEPVHGWNQCWMPASQAAFQTGEIGNVPVAIPRLPYSDQYNPPDATARRNGSEVTVSWKAVGMSLDDYRGYLIETWVCQAGTQVFLPVGYEPPLAANTGTLSVTLTDDPGCSVPSSGHIYSAGKRGYSASGKIPWPTP